MAAKSLPLRLLLGGPLKESEVRRRRVQIAVFLFLAIAASTSGFLLGLPRTPTEDPIWIQSIAKLWWRIADSFGMLNLSAVIVAAIGVGFSIVWAGVIPIRISLWIALLAWAFALFTYGITPAVNYLIVFVVITLISEVAERYKIPYLSSVQRLGPVESKEDPESPPV